jgi:hypothetical protein
MQRFLLIVLVIVLVAAGVGYVVLDRQQQSALAAAQASADEALGECRQSADRMARDFAADIARCLAANVADEVGSGDSAALDGRLAVVVQGNRILSVVVLAPGGRVLAATDLRYRGRVLDDDATRAALAATGPEVLDAAPAPGQLEAVAPLAADGQKVGAVRVVVAAGPGGES